MIIHTPATKDLYSYSNKMIDLDLIVFYSVGELEPEPGSRDFLQGAGKKIIGSRSWTR